VNKKTLYNWMRDARAVDAELKKGTKNLTRLSQKDKLLVEFLYSVESALASCGLSYSRLTSTPWKHLTKNDRLRGVVNRLKWPSFSE